MLSVWSYPKICSLAKSRMVHKINFVNPNHVINLHKLISYADVLRPLLSQQA